MTLRSKAEAKLGRALTCGASIVRLSKRESPELRALAELFVTYLSVPEVGKFPVNWVNRPGFQAYFFKPACQFRMTVNRRGLLGESHHKE